MNLKLIRTVSDDNGTFGQLFLPNGKTLFSGELPWRGNSGNLSCIPNGVYPCVWQFSPHFKRELYHVTNVADRSAVEIHPANFMGDTTKGLKSDLEGCIALGQAFGLVNGQKTLAQSRAAIQIFEDLLNKQQFDLEVSYL